MTEGFMLSVYPMEEGLGDGAPKLPKFLRNDGTLESDLSRIAEAIRYFVQASSVDTDSDHAIRTFSFNLVGPIDDVEEKAERKKPEELLAATETTEDRFYALDSAAKSSFSNGQFDQARVYALELLQLSSQFRSNWNFGNAISCGNIVLGRLALLAGDVEEAKQRLREAGTSPGSPQMNTFGPNMSLAHDLLLIGERSAVIDYFEACRVFWDMHDEKLDIWTMYVNAGRIPEFDGNLDY